MSRKRIANLETSILKLSNALHIHNKYPIDFLQKSFLDDGFIMNHADTLSEDWIPLIGCQGVSEQVYDKIKHEIDTQCGMETTPDQMAAHRNFLEFFKKYANRYDVEFVWNPKHRASLGYISEEFCKYPVIYIRTEPGFIYTIIFMQEKIKVMYSDHLYDLYGFGENSFFDCEFTGPGVIENRIMSDIPVRIKNKKEYNERMELFHQYELVKKAMFFQNLSIPPTHFD